MVIGQQAVQPRGSSSGTSSIRYSKLTLKKCLASQKQFMDWFAKLVVSYDEWCCKLGPRPFPIIHFLRVITVPVSCKNKGIVHLNGWEHTYLWVGDIFTITIHCFHSILIGQVLGITCFSKNRWPGHQLNCKDHPSKDIVQSPPHYWNHSFAGQVCSCVVRLLGQWWWWCVIRLLLPSKVAVKTACIL